jgi:hypothetical protein
MAQCQATRGAEARYHITVRFRLRVSSKSGKTSLACIYVRQFVTVSCFERDRLSEHSYSNTVKDILPAPNWNVTIPTVLMGPYTAWPEGTAH